MHLRGSPGVPSSLRLRSHTIPHCAMAVPRRQRSPGPSGQAHPPEGGGGGGASRGSDGTLMRVVQAVA